MVSIIQNYLRQICCQFIFRTGIGIICLTLMRDRLDEDDTMAKIENTQHIFYVFVLHSEKESSYQSHSANRTSQMYNQYNYYYVLGNCNAQVLTFHSIFVVF